MRPFLHIAMSLVQDEDTHRTVRHICVRAIRIELTATTSNSSQLTQMHHELTAYIVALFLETLLFGAFTVTYTMGASSLLTTIASRRRSIRAWVLLGASTTMFGLALAVRLLYEHGISELNLSSRSISH